MGDPWTLVVLRDLLTGKRAYREFLQSPERISTNILANRLRRLEGWGIVVRRPYRAKPERFDYELTKKGADLLPTLQQLCRWANRYMEDTWRPPDYFMMNKPDQLLRRLNRVAPAPG